VAAREAGENIAPVPIENAIKKAAQGVISNCVMLGDKQRFNVCLITIVCEGATGELPGSSVLEGPAKALVQGVGTLAAACKNKKFVKFIQDAVEAANNDGLVCPSKTSRVHKFTILPHDFSIQTGELTATLKTRRSECFKIYAGIIDKLYASTEQDGMYVRSDGGGDA
jgi:long-subunit acyl-CoA synthetase (AMP-forming)